MCGWKRCVGHRFATACEWHVFGKQISRRSTESHNSLITLVNRHVVAVFRDSPWTASPSCIPSEPPLGSRSANSPFQPARERGGGECKSGRERKKEKDRYHISLLNLCSNLIKSLLGSEKREKRGSEGERREGKSADGGERQARAARSEEAEAREEARKRRKQKGLRR